MLPERRDGQVRAIGSLLLKGDGAESQRKAEGKMQRMRRKQVKEEREEGER